MKLELKFEVDYKPTTIEGYLDKQLQARGFALSKPLSNPTGGVSSPFVNRVSKGENWEVTYDRHFRHEIMDFFCKKDRRTGMADYTPVPLDILIENIGKQDSFYETISFEQTEGDNPLNSCGLFYYDGRLHSISLEGEKSYIGAIKRHFDVDGDKSKIQWILERRGRRSDSVIDELLDFHLANAAHKIQRT